jgi:hypothetical protein
MRSSAHGGRPVRHVRGPHRRRDGRPSRTRRRAAASSRFGRPSLSCPASRCSLARAVSVSKVQRQTTGMDDQEASEPRGDPRPLRPGIAVVRFRPDNALAGRPVRAPRATRHALSLVVLNRASVADGRARSLLCGRRAWRLSRSLLLPRSPAHTRARSVPRSAPFWWQDGSPRRPPYRAGHRVSLSRFRDRPGRIARPVLARGVRAGASAPVEEGAKLRRCHPKPNEKRGSE